MMTRFVLADYPWDRVRETQRFITDLFCGPAPDRPALVMHLPPVGEAHPMPAGLDEWQLQVWHATEQLRRRPLGLDDFVPILSTGAGNCALATAFGCVEKCAANVYWAEPCITGMEQIDALRKPRVTDGKLGRVLEQTRAYAACADERLPIRVMEFQSPFTTVEQMLGSDRFFLMPYDEPARLHQLMDVVTDFAIEFFTAQLVAAGPHGCPGVWPNIWFPRQAGIQMSDDNLVNVSPAVYEEFVVPYNNRVAEAFGGLFLHSCTITEAALPTLSKLTRLTGINCDISTSVATARLLETFAPAVVAPHAYINTNTNFRSYTAYMRGVLEGWRPGMRLFVYPCPVLYQPDRACEIAFDAEEVRAVLADYPGWQRDHATLVAGSS
jgi:hypothetical protein